MDNLININDYTNLKILYPKKIYSWTIILILMITIIIFGLFKLKFDFYYKNTGIVIENNLIKTNIPSNKLQHINNKFININNKNYNYEIIKIEVPSVNSVDLSYYHEVLISVKNYKEINNNLIDFKIMYDSKKLIEIIKEFIFGEGK